jgi:hypothetical protein
MKKIFYIFLFTPLFGLSQQEINLPIDFELYDNLFQVDSNYFSDFNGGSFSVIDNPFQTDMNTSKWVGKIVRNGGDVWAGSKIQLNSNLNFASNNLITLQIYTQAPVGTQVRLKIEDSNYLDLGDPCFEVDTWTTVSNEWEILSFDFINSPPFFNNIAFMFDFNIIGDGSEPSTFYFDNIQHTNSLTTDIYGCTYEIACNYNFEANIDDGSCVFQEVYYYCDGNCVNDFDNDGECDEVDYDDGLEIFNPHVESIKLIKMIDIFGVEQNIHMKGVLLFYIYDNGRVDKKFIP